MGAIWHSISIALTVYDNLSSSVKFLGSTFVTSSSESASSLFCLLAYFPYSACTLSKTCLGFPVNPCPLNYSTVFYVPYSNEGSSLKLKVSFLLLKKCIRIEESFVWECIISFEIDCHSNIIGSGWCKNFAPKE